MPGKVDWVDDGAARDAEAAHDEASDHAAQRRNTIRSGSRTRKSAVTRERIMAAATRLMSEYGSTDFQMSEVSSLCHMSKGSLYYYFSDRDELVDAIFSGAVDDLVNAIEDTVGDAPTAREALTGIGAEFSRRMRPGSPLALAISRELARGGVDVLSSVQTHLSRAVRIVARQLERAKDEGVVREDVDARVSATFVTGGFLVAAASSVATGHPSDHDALARQLVDLALRGIGA